ncbi:MAG TPA: hypothetical protein VHB77_18875, partial [Planctomycetaceae bacterium]|nr:hypothetical protein [Planctomycetaceae bacterium]
FGTTPGSLGDAVSRSRGGSGTNGGTGTGTQKSGRQGGTSVAANRGAGSPAGGWGDGFGPSSSGKGDGTGTGTGSGTATGGDAPYAQLGLGSGEEGDENSSSRGGRMVGGAPPRGGPELSGYSGPPGSSDDSPGEPTGATPGGTDASLTTLLDRNPFDPAANAQASRAGTAPSDGTTGGGTDQQNDMQNPNGTPGAGGSKRNLPKGAQAGSASRNVVGASPASRSANGSTSSDMTGGGSSRALSGRPGNGTRSGSNGPGQTSSLSFNPTGDKHVGDRAARNRWGGAEHATVRMQHEVPMQITPTQVIIGNANDEIVIAVGRGESAAELLEQVLNGMDRYSENWGDPPDGFYWVPAVNFRVYPGGNQHYERLHTGLRNWGVYSKVDYVIPDKPVKQRNVKKNTNGKS